MPPGHFSLRSYQYFNIFSIPLVNGIGSQIFLFGQSIIRLCHMSYPISSWNFLQSIISIFSRYKSVVSPMNGIDSSICGWLFSSKGYSPTMCVMFFQCPPCNGGLLLHHICRVCRWAGDCHGHTTACTCDRLVLTMSFTSTVLSISGHAMNALVLRPRSTWCKCAGMLRKFVPSS